MATTPLDDAIQTAALDPASATVDGQSVTSRPVADIILADQYAAARRAQKAGRVGWAAVHRSQVIPPSAIGG